LVVHDTIAGAIVPNHLQVGARPVVEDIERIAARVGTELIADDASQAIERETEIDRRGGDVDGRGRADHDRPPGGSRAESAAWISAGATAL
jgi:hypothetical protein